jgi:hypothetical protein
MAELTHTRPVARFVALGVASALTGLSGCSSGSDSSSKGNVGTTGDSGSGALVSGDDGGAGSSDASIGCAGDPRAEAFTPNLTHKGDSGMLSFVIAGSNFSPPAVDNNTWTLKVLDASGQPVKDAVLSFPANGNPSDPWMPDHSHGALPAKATNNMDGTYTIAPLYFFMGGIWKTYIEATSGSVKDSTTFTFCVGS